MTDKTLKVCTTCRWCQKDWIQGPGHWRCISPELPFNALTGQTIKRLCTQERSNADSCGSEGKRWQAQRPLFHRILLLLKLPTFGPLDQ